MDRKHLEEFLFKANATTKENPRLADRYDRFLRNFRRYEARFHGKESALHGQSFRKDDKI